MPKKSSDLATAHEALDREVARLASHGPIGFGGSQTYNFIGYDLFGNACYGEIFLSGGEATSPNALLPTVISNYIVQNCY